MASNSHKIVTDRLELKVPSSEWVFSESDGREEFSIDLVETMLSHSGIGLAAPQMGIKKRVIAVRGAPENYVMFNPRIVWLSEETVSLEEGCVSFPNLFVKVKRPAECRVRFEAPDGTTYTRHFKGMTARVVQHEIDHLDGVLFFERAGRVHRDRAFRQMRRAR